MRPLAAFVCEPKPGAEAQTLFNILASVGLTLFAGLMSGLTLGLMSLDHVDLEVQLAFAFDGYQGRSALAENLTGVLNRY